MPENLTPEQARQRFAHASTLYQQGKFQEALLELGELAKAYPHDKHIITAQQKCWETLESKKTVISATIPGSNGIMPMTVDDLVGPSKAAADPPGIEPAKHYTPKPQTPSKRRWLIPSVIAASVVALFGLYYGITGSHKSTPPASQ